MSSPWIPFYLLLLLVHACRGQNLITLSVQPNVTSNVTVCPNLMVEFTCNASEVGVLMWRVNGTEIETFTSSSGVNSTLTDGPFTARLISNQQIQGSAARNYLSTLTVQSVSQLDVGSVIECLDAPDSLQSINVNYTAIGIPRILSLAVNVTPSQDGSASIILTFDATENVDMYSIAVSQGIDCPQSCTPSVSCMCTGLTPGENVMVNLNVSAVNCDTQIGSVYEVSLTPRVPGVPSSCWVVPVYNATTMGPLVGVLAMWNNVPNPPYLTNNVNQNVLNYSVSVNGEMIPVPVGTACPMNRTCSTDLGSYYNQNSNSLFEASVAAMNIFGSGSTQTCDVPPINAMNTLFNIVVEESGRTVRCEALGEARSNIVCQFCYGILNDCDNSLMCVNVTTTSQLSDVSEGTTYCYRVTAFRNGIPVALIQDSFTVSSTSVASWIIALSVISVVICFVLLVVTAVIIGLKIKDKGQFWKDTTGLCMVIIVLDVFVIVVISIILLVVYGATSNSDLVAAAFTFSLLGALFLSIGIVVMVILQRNKSESEDINSTADGKVKQDDPLKPYDFHR